MTAHWVVLAAAALTTLVAAAVGAALAVFAGQALPQAVRHDLTTAPGTSLAAVGGFGGGNAGGTTAALRSAVGGALAGVPDNLWSGTWSDPLGFVNGSLPARPATLSSGTTPLLEAAALDAITSHAVLVSGSWPGTPAASGAIPAALPATTAALLRLHVGDALTTEDRNTNTRVTFEVTGLYAERQLSGSAGAYWQLNSIPASGSSTMSDFITYGPLVVSPAAFPGRLAEASGTWVVQPDMAAFSGSELATVSANVATLESSLNTSSSLNGLQVTSSLPAVLSGIGNNLAVARSLLAISGLQLLVLAVAALLAVARLLATQREGETALLIARGATRWQLTRLTAIEVIPLALVTALGGGVASIWLARLLSGTLFNSGTPGGGISLTAGGTWFDALGTALGVAVLAVGALLYPLVRPAPGSARVRRGRQAMLAGATRAGADLALIALAVLAGWQLRRYSAVSTSANGAAAAIDPVLALAPAIALAGGTVLTLRLLPAAARVTDRLAAGGRRLTAALAGWQFSRQPLRQGGAALLLVMAVATGTLALAQHQSWSRSAADQAAFTAGADVRVDLATPLGPGATATVTRASGVQAAMAVASTQQALPSAIEAIDSAQAPKVALMRADESTLPSAALFKTITPPAATGGVVIPGRPPAVTLTATLSPAALGTVTATFTVIDAAGDAFQLAAAGPLPADGRPHVLSAPLGGTGAAYPLRLTQVTLTYTLPAKALRSPVTLTVAGASTGTWLGAASSPELSTQVGAGAAYGPTGFPHATGWKAVPGGATLTFSPGFGQVVANPFAPPPLIPQPVAGQVTLTAADVAPATVPAIATSAFVDANKTGLGATVATTIDGLTVPARIVAVVSEFPTITGSALIMDLPTLQAFLARAGGAPLSVTEWWLATDGHTVPASLARALPPGAAITSSSALAAATAADPLSAAPQQALLAVAAAAALLAITGFWVSIAANVRQRRAENALLAALGVNQRSAAVQLFVEKLLLSVPAAVLGLVLGTVVARLLVPAVTLTTTAQRPVPAPVTQFDLPQTIPLALAVAVIPALAAALVVFRRPDPAAELRAAEAS